ncbi:hypothetical protein [Bdellovibrio bacteriovorus]|uniref:hypothetical protein n=1 Tax=Bdellovibrio bacteriovorus TaxID=959 RepID=UPI003AA8B55E
MALLIRKTFDFCTDTRWSAWLFSLALSLVYIGLALVGANHFPERKFLEVSALALFSVCIILGAFHFKHLDRYFSGSCGRVSLDSNFFHFALWGAFIVFMLITLITAKDIPLVSAFKGANADILSLQRGAFLKGRTGVQSILIYIDTLFMATLLPFSLAGMFVEKNRFRYLAAVVFFFYSICCLQKALFFYVGFPLVYLAAQHFKLKIWHYFAIVTGFLSVLFVLTFLASGKLREVKFFDDALSGYVERGHWDEAIESPKKGKVIEKSEFFSAQYQPKSTVDFIVWRSLSVPVFTASDTLIVFDKEFGGNYLKGATSGTLSRLFGLEPVSMERHVFAYQWGWNDTANANAVFFVDAFVNFGLVGVLIYSIIVGLGLRFFWQSKDVPFKSLWLIFCCLLFSGSLVGTLLSNGYIFIFVFILVFRLVPSSVRARDGVGIQN